MTGLLLKYWRELAIIAVVVGGLLYFRWIHADRDHWKDAARDWKEAAASYQSAYTESEARRVLEGRNARTAINEAQGACDARVETARRSAKTIHTIVNRKVPVDASNCPVRPVIDTRSLSDALRPTG